MDRPHPFISIVVPTFNRPKRLKACLKALRKLRYPEKYHEIIVIDDGSSPPVPKAISDISGKTRITRHGHNRGPSAARNRGACEAKGDLLVFTDDDCVPPPDWLGNIARRYQARPDSIICGRVLDSNPYNIFSKAGQVFWDFLNDHFNKDPENPRCMNSANMAIPRNLFKSIGGFDERLKQLEDRDLCERIRAAGFKMMYASGITVFHNHPTSFTTFWRQHFTWGKGAFNLRFSRSRQEKRVGFESIWFYSKLVFRPFLSAPSSETAKVSLLMVLSQIATVWGFFMAWAYHQLAKHRVRGVL